MYTFYVGLQSYRLNSLNNLAMHSFLESFPSTSSLFAYSKCKLFFVSSKRK